VLKIADITGKIVLQQTIIPNEMVAVSHLYILKLIKDNQVSVHKFVKK